MTFIPSKLKRDHTLGLPAFTYETPDPRKVVLSPGYFDYALGLILSPGDLITIINTTNRNRVFQVCVKRDGTGVQETNITMG